ncbi:MAG: hypothetical protein QOD48_2362 [Gaiellaceae bacterium]|jgi:hypothetical protein|nr:hypothetical protein [Mycobacterium sp.]MDX6456255.1 hypothetical protein [Gaiellaceae bacterium]
MMTTQTEITHRNHHRAVRFFWAFLIWATLVSLIGNIVHAIWHLIPVVAIQIGTAAVPPLFLLAVVHGIALSVRAGASGTVYRWAVTATAVIGVGAFVMSFRALRDLVIHTGIPPVWAWLFPAIIDTAIGVSTMMLVALGDKPARRARTVSTQTASVQRSLQGANTQFNASAPTTARAQKVQAARIQTSVSEQPRPVHKVRDSAQTEAQVDADIASELIASGVTTQPLETVIAVLATTRDGASINAAANASGINYRTAQRIVDGAAERRQRQLVAVR